MNIDSIPAELKAIPRWLLWRLETRAGKATKVPFQADGRPAKVNDPATWTSYESALTAYHAGGFSGLGIVLTEADDLVGVDLDGCVNPDTGELNDEAAAIVAMLPTYCEVSPGGRGLRMFGFGTLPPGGRRKGAVEIYSAGRYLTVTGNRFNGHAALANITSQLAEVHARIFGKPAVAKPVATKTRPADPSDLDDVVLLDKAHRARNGGDFSRLWNGDTSAHDGDDSAADLALCNHLAFWTKCDPSRVDKLFRQSGLMRPKWDERRGESGTYGQMTIAKALDSARSEPRNRSRHHSKSPSQPSQPSQEAYPADSKNNNFENNSVPAENKTVPAVPGDDLRPYFFMVNADKSRISTCPELAKHHEIDVPGLYYVPLVQQKDGRATQSKHGAPCWISIPFELLATTDDGQGHGHGLAFHFRSIHGHEHTWTIPRALLVMEGREMFQKLYEMGFHMAVSEGAFGRLREYLNRARSEWVNLSKALSVARTGWAPGPHFVLPDEIFGEQGMAIFYQSEDPRPSPYTTAGTLAGWRDAVARELADFDLPVFAVSCAFAGPLLEPLRIESGGFHFEGLTSTGKTTAQRWALSVWGNYRDLMQTWNGTRVGVELVTAAYSDTLLVLDEIGQADPRAVGEIVYLICNEFGRTRGNARLMHRANLRWRALLLSSGEKSLTQIMAGPGGYPPAAGQETRLAHVPADVDGCGVLTGLKDPGARKELLATITAGAKVNHGHAGRAFLNRLTAPDGLPDPDEAVGQVKALAASWAGPDSTNEIDRVALRFALVGFAGELASEWGITGWPAGRALEAARAMFMRWRAGWGAANRDETLFLLRCDEWLVEHQTGSFAEIDPQTRDVLDERRKSGLRPFFGYTSLSDERRTYYLNAAGWKALTQNAGRGVAVKALCRVGRLEGGDGDGGKRERIGGERQRFYVVHTEKD
mgnify:FL=1